MKPTRGPFHNLLGQLSQPDKQKRRSPPRRADAERLPIWRSDAAERAGFTIVAVLTLALGNGATSAVFSLIEGVLLSPPPYREPNRLVLVDSARTDNRTMESP